MVCRDWEYHFLRLKNLLKLVPTVLTIFPWTRMGRMGHSDAFKMVMKI